MFDNIVTLDFFLDTMQYLENVLTLHTCSTYK